MNILFKFTLLTHQATADNVAISVVHGVRPSIRL